MTTEYFDMVDMVLVFKVEQDPCYYYVCIYLKTMHDLRRLKPTEIEIFVTIYY